MIKVGTAFSGIGSPEVALKNLNIDHEIVFACEKDKFARQTWLSNHETKIMFNDFTTVDYTQIEQLDLFVAGFPCQSFSMAGKRKGFEEARGTLFFNCAEFIRINQPKYFILENVKGIISHDKGKTFNIIINLLSGSVNGQEHLMVHDDSLLYNIHWNVLNSKDFGVPQNRERVFIVGIRKDLPDTFRFPYGFPLTKRLKDILEPVVDEKYYLSDKMLKYMAVREKRYAPPNIRDLDGISSCITVGGEGKSGGDMNLIKEPTMLSGSDVCNTIRTGGKGSLTAKHSWDVIIVPEATEPICVAMRGRNPENSSDRTTGSETEQRLEPNSQGITNTITSVQNDNLILLNEPIKLEQVGQLPGFEQNGRIYDESGRVPTLRAKSNEINMLIKNRIRRLTPLECMRLQGFPDSFIKPCSDSQTYKQAGNSITTFVIQAIIKNLLNL